MTVRILNIAILVVALLLSALLFKKFFFNPAQQSPNYQLSTNSSLRINGINWADSDRTVLLAHNVPTLAILDQSGVVTDMWGGKFSPLEEQALMSKLQLEDTRSADEWSIDEASLGRRVAHKELLLLLDIRERAPYAMNHRDGARNIPLDELRVRAPNELPLDHTIVIYGNDRSEIDLAYSILDSQGFANLLILVQNATDATKQSP